MKFASQRIGATTPVEIETYSEWTAASEVQQRFLQYQHPRVDTLSYSAQC
jgi:hypothetical protein